MRRKAAFILAALLAVLPLISSAGVLAKMRVPDIPYENKDPNRYLIEIDRRNQIVTIYEQDAEKNILGIVRRFLCTTGGSGSATPGGTFKMGEMRERFGYFANFNTYAQYWCQITRGIYIHSILFSRRDEAYLERSAYNNIGRAVSHGCVRALVEDARWIYYNCPPGTTVVVTSKPRDSALAQSLKTGVPFGEYEIAPDPYPQPAPVFGVMSVRAEYRTGFGGKDRRLGMLAAGTQVEVTQLSPLWSKIRIDGTRKEGYIYTKYLTVQSADGQWIIVDRVKTATAKLYESASTRSGVLAAFGFLTTVRILAGSGRFYYVRVGEKEGYMPQSALESVGLLLSPGERYAPVYNELPLGQDAPG